MNKNKEFNLNPVSARIYLFSFKYKNGIKRYELIDEMNEKLKSKTKNQSVHDRIKLDKLVEKNYLKY